MNFTAFEKSNFFYTGCGRYNLVNHNFLIHDGLAMFDYHQFNILSSKNPTIDKIDMPRSRICIMHLSHALSINSPPVDGAVSFDDDNKNRIWLPDEFRELLINQWIEVVDIIDSIVDNKRLENSNKEFKMLHSKLIITKPGIVVDPHYHACPQTLTICYSFNEDKIESAEPSNFKMGWDSKHKIDLPNTDKFLFTMIDNPPHALYTNEWKFWWTVDFSDYFDVPEGLPFHYWNEPLLNRNNCYYPSLKECIANAKPDDPLLKQTWYDPRLLRY
jgi:hypothetical protein